MFSLGTMEYRLAYRDKAYNNGNDKKNRIVKEPTHLEADPWIRGDIISLTATRNSLQIFTINSYNNDNTRIDNHWTAWLLVIF